MEPILIAIAFVCGMGTFAINLPPLVGFLIAGFLLNYMGFESTPVIQTIADLGVTLLLFTIGLKLNVRSLLSPKIWAGASLHLLITVGMFLVSFIALKQLGLNLLSDLATPQLLIIAFALSFSSTVFVVKILEEKSDSSALYGRLAVGILIMQDIFAVLFLTFSTGKIPSVWALSLIALPLIRPVLIKLLVHAGHGELQVLYGVFLALVVGAAGFELVGMKADLGALVVGMLLSGHSATNHLAKSLFNMKELFLVCFFLNIGLTGLPTIEYINFSLILLVLLAVKVAMYFFVITGFKLRARTAALSSLALANYSEFGLIVASLASVNGWLPAEWLVIIALALSFSYVVASPINYNADNIYLRFTGYLKRFERKPLDADDQPITINDEKILVFGMGRIGSGAYDELKEQFGDVVLGVDTDNDRVSSHVEKGRNVLVGDATDSDFWSQFANVSQFSMVLLAMTNHHGNVCALKQLRDQGFTGKISAIAQFYDEIQQLRDLGIDAVFNIYEEAGSGFAKHVCDSVELNRC